MRHAGHPTLALLEPLLARLRALEGLTERKAGTFYRRGSAFLHFHEDPAGLFADAKLDGRRFERFPVDTPDQQAALLGRVAESLSARMTAAAKRSAVR